MFRTLPKKLEGRREMLPSGPRAGERLATRPSGQPPDDSPWLQGGTTPFIRP